MSLVRMQKVHVDGDVNEGFMNIRAEVVGLYQCDPEAIGGGRLILHFRALALRRIARGVTCGVRAHPKRKSDNTDGRTTRTDGLPGWHQTFVPKRGAANTQAKDRDRGQSRARLVQLKRHLQL